MPFTAVTPTVPLGPYPAGGVVGATALNLTETACDTVNGNSFPLTGREILILHNTGASAYTVTISSVADSKGRADDIAAYSIPAGTIAVFSFRGGLEGWGQTDNTVHVTASNASVKMTVLTTPT
jgi:hypothetical protein